MVQKPRTILKQQVIMTVGLQQRLAVLEMSRQELIERIQEELDKNPVLEAKKLYSPKHPFPEMVHIHSLEDSLKQQIRENFSENKDRALATKIMRYLDEKGFLSHSIEELAKEISVSTAELESIIRTLQTFEPPGIFARNLQESLLLQLKAKGEEGSLPFRIVEHCFEELIHGRYSSLKKKMKREDLAKAIQKLASLQLRPLSCLKREIAIPIIPDLKVFRSPKEWLVLMNDEEFPEIEINLDYTALAPSSIEEKETLKTWHSEARNLLDSIVNRRKLLLKVAKYLTHLQSDFLSSRGNLKPLSVQELSLLFGLHESTMSRILSSKYIETPRGTFPLKELLCFNPEAKKVKEILVKLIQNENKEHPVTDEEIAQELKKQGHLIARRTIAKYRKTLGFLPSKARKNF